MKGLFRDRVDGGQLLANALAKYANRNDVIVLGLPRGGVPVAFEVARKLKAPLDVFVVRKLGVPGHRELAMGAIATGGVRVLNEEVIGELGLSQLTIDAVAAEEQKELARRELAYRGHDAPPTLRGRTVILVDDGIATGSTMRAAVRAARRQQPSRIVVAVPTAAPSSYAQLKREADEIVALMTPEDFYAVGQWYEDFSQTTDEDVTRLLATIAHPTEESMPLYEYICKKCHKKFGEVLTFKEHDTKKIHCPRCTSEDVEKVVEPFFAKTASKTGSW